MKVAGIKNDDDGTCSMLKYFENEDNTCNVYLGVNGTKKDTTLTATTIRTFVKNHDAYLAEQRACYASSNREETGSIMSLCQNGEMTLALYSDNQCANFSKQVCF